jgi:hypothetical protein
VNVGPLSLVLPPVLSILAPAARRRYRSRGRHGLVRSPPQLQRYLGHHSATDVRENRHGCLTEGGARSEGYRGGGEMGHFLSLCSTKT